MAYYNKKEVQEYFTESLSMIEKDQKTHRLLSSPEELARQFKDDEDILGIFWTTSVGEKIEMNGKAFVQVEPDLYTDDRFAVDCQLSVKEGVTVGDIVRKRKLDQEQAKKFIEEKSPDQLLNLLK